MAKVRFAFTVETRGDSAVVCRAFEGRSGPVTQKRFGVFKSLSDAHAHACRLNKELGIVPEDAREIVFSALLAKADALRSALARSPANSPIRPRLIAAMARLLLSQLDACIGFCLTARTPGEPQHDASVDSLVLELAVNASDFASRAEIPAKYRDELTRRLNQFFDRMTAVAQCH